MKNKKLIPLILGLAFVFTLTYFIIIKNSTRNQSLTFIPQQNIIKLQPKTSEENGVSFEVTPLDFSFDKSIKFEIRIDTHSGSLDFDLVKISSLEDDKGNRYQPLEWQGSSPGDHHFSGILIFPKLNSQTQKLKLIIEDKLSRVFEWTL